MRATASLTENRPDGEPHVRKSAPLAPLIFDSAYPFLGGLIGGGVAAWFFGRADVLLDGTHSFQQVFSSTIDVTAIIVGFLAALKSLLPREGKMAKFALESNLYGRLDRAFAGTIRLGFLVLSLSVVALIFESLQYLGPAPKRWFLAVWVGLISWAALSSYRAISAALLVARHDNR